MKIAVVTTFHEKGLNLYAQRMIDTFSQNWPKSVKLYLYPEKCSPVVRDVERTVVRDLDSVADLAKFKETWKDDPKARGWCEDSTKKLPDKQQKIGFRWDAIRFSNKVYAIFDCAANTDADLLFWMDADMVCHSPITEQQIRDLSPSNFDLCYLGREGKFSECGLYSMNLRSDRTQKFLEEFKRVWDDAENGIFKMAEWHDSFVFDQVRSKCDLVSLNWSQGLIQGEGHPLINSQWGAYLDHLKGEDRKLAGKSKVKDIKVKRTENYWR